MRGLSGFGSIALLSVVLLGGCSNTGDSVSAEPLQPVLAAPMADPAKSWKIIVVKEPLAGYWVGWLAGAVVNPILKSYHEFIVLQNDRGELVDEINAYCEKFQDKDVYVKESEASLFGDGVSRLGVYNGRSKPGQPSVAILSPGWAEHSLFHEPVQPDWTAETYVLSEADAVTRWHHALEIGQKINQLKIIYTDTARQGGVGRNSNSVTFTILQAIGLGDPTHDAFIRDAYGAGINILPDEPRLLPLIPAAPLHPYGPDPKEGSYPPDLRNIVLE